MQTVTATIRNSFSACEEVSPTFFKCEKHFGNRVRGIYFIDTSDQLPTAEQLVQINSNFVAPSYFRSNDASRWNHYLIWVASDEKRGDAAFIANRKVLEGNKDYARKLIIFESDLEDFIGNSVEVGTDSGPVDSIASVWGNILNESGLSEIQSDIKRATLIQKIRTTDLTEVRKVYKSSRGVAPDDHSTKHLASISIEKFGNRTIRGHFPFSRVNLIRGVNGTGKTSLLESLEHFFCGGTRRANGKTEALHASITFVGGRSPVKYSLESNSVYQARDLSWYGRNINKGNGLYQGFARYNFFDTDAAVRFANDNRGKELKDMLAIVALGPDVSRTWARIREFADDIERDLAPLRRSIKALKANLSVARKRIAALQTVSPNTQALVSVIEAHPLSNVWKLPNKDGSSLQSNWFENIVPLRSLVQRLNHLPGITTLKDIDISLSQMRKDIELLKENYDTASRIKVLFKEAKNHIAQGEENHKSLLRLAEYMRADFGTLVTRKTDLQRLIAASPIKSPGSVGRWVAVLKEIPDSSRTLLVVRKGLDRELASARSMLAETSEQQRRLSANLDIRDSIRLKLRQLGKEYIESYEELDTCPLCLTVMNAQMLLKRIESTLDTIPEHEKAEQATARSTLLEKKVSQLSDASQAIETAVTLFPFLESASLTQTIVVLEEAVSNAAELNSQIEDVKSDLVRLERLGFSQTEYNFCTQVAEVYAKTAQRQAPTNETEVIALLDSLARRLSDQRLLSHDFELQITAITSQLQAILTTYSVNIDPEGDLIDAYKQLNEQIDLFMGLRIDLAKLPVGTIPSEGENLRIFTSQAAELIERVNALSLALKDEKSKSDELAILQQQVLKDERCLSREEVEARRLQTAFDVLSTIRSNHSLDSGLADFLSKNFTAIQKIFSRIHAPNELRLASDHSGDLERSCGKTFQRVSLDQISTGQRTAFVLSVFTMLNLSLRNAPPIMLIDDPIAHVDDLNCLSYLDFIADVAESGERQIFFATANDKLGNLFEKKLGYLDDRLRVIDMTRL